MATHEPDQPIYRPMGGPYNTTSDWWWIAGTIAIVAVVLAAWAAWFATRQEEIDRAPVNQAAPANPGTPAREPAATSQPVQPIESTSPLEPAAVEL